METVSEKIEHYIISAISTDKYLVGSPLPSERELSKEISVNRCSLRTAMKALEKDGWIKIQHGSATKVMGFLDNCQINAAIQRVKYVDDDLSQSLKSGVIDTFFDIIYLLLQKEISIEINLLLSELGDSINCKEAFINNEALLANSLAQKNKNKVYALLVNQLTPLYEIYAPNMLTEEAMSNRYALYSMLKESSLVNHYL